MNWRRIDPLFLKAALFFPVAAVLCFSGVGNAQTPIGKISDYSGTVIVLSGSYVTKVSKSDVPLKSRDILTTEDGRVVVLFNDGAAVEMEPYSLIMVLEGMEESRGGLGAIMNQKEAVRRIPVYVGKARFKSGSSSIRNCIQTPSAVCTISGSEAYWGSDYQGGSFLEVVTGQTRIVGNFVEGYFENPGIGAASKCKLYQDLKEAYEATLSDPGKGRVMALQFLIAAFSALLDSPDPAVVALAEDALAALRQEMVSLQEALNEEMEIVQAVPWDEAEQEIRQLEEELEKLQRELEGLEEEKVMEEEAVPFVTSTTTTTTTVFPTEGDRVISTPQ